MWTTNDIEKIEERGSDVASVEKQITYFKEGFPFLRLESSAVVGDGIIRLEEGEVQELVTSFDTVVAESDLTLLKFVPASGAATRMFKSLFSFLEEGKSDKSVDHFFENLNDFAFFNALEGALANDGIAIGTADRKTIVQYFLTGLGLGYGYLPKGLLQFHAYENASRTPLEEHLVEAGLYAKAGGMANLHFTVSPEHRDKFEKHVVEKIPQYESKFGLKYFVSFSEQEASTDTIAVNLDNSPFREKDGSLLFRPAGHGALIENLSKLNADVIFIKNIDNVVPDRLKQATVDYKKALLGVLLRIQQQIFAYLAKAETDTSEELLLEIEAFLRQELNVIPPVELASQSLSARWEYVISKLDRPTRVCGMVRNEGEPGGGPFWVKNQDGSVSLQIVESAQIDMDDAEQKAIAHSATHFNPVDLVCGVKNRAGELYDLKQFVDPLTGFITQKSKDGKELKAQELPGLWNGAMANWNTLFVEVPLITFNPVKTVNDLLREQHQ